MHKLSTRCPLLLDAGRADRLPGTIGIEHDEWHAEARRLGSTVIVSVTAPDLQQALAQLVASEAPMDCWFKDGVRRLTGSDLPALFA